MASQGPRISFDSRLLVYLQYNLPGTLELLSLAFFPGVSSRKRVDNPVHFSDRVVEMWGDPEPVTARRCHYVLGLEAGVKSHWGKIAAMSNAENLRLLTYRSRTHNLIIGRSQSVAK